MGFAFISRLAAQSKCHIGISPSGQKMGHWDLSQSHVQDVSGTDPNVKKRGFFLSVPMSCTGSIWDCSQLVFFIILGQIQELFKI